MNEGQTKESKDPLECKRYHVTFPYSVRQGFEVFTRYNDVAPEGLGSGSYGYVCEATDTRDGKRVAIKKLIQVFDDEQRTKSCLRELKLLAHFSEHGPHDTILRLLDVMIPIGNFDESHRPMRDRLADFSEVYLVTELYDYTLKHLIQNSQGTLTDSYRASFTHQILKGLIAIHTAGCVHRDLKPENLLVKQLDTYDFALCICDFGSGRDYDPNTEADLTNPNLVTSLWYRPPEVLLQKVSETGSSSQHLHAIDIWAVGCIMAEMVTQQPVFKAGVGPVPQLARIEKYLAPDVEDGQDPPLKGHLSKADATEHELSLILSMLRYESADRISSAAALAHPFLADYAAEGTPSCEKFTCTTKEGDERNEIWRMAMEFQPAVRDFIEAKLKKDDDTQRAKDSATAPET